jgi:DnaJ family protein A protein 2
MSSSKPKKDYYGILNISKDADENTIKKAYRTLAQKWHPDKNKDPDAEDKFKEITEAYSILSDHDKRQKYDQFGLCDGESPDFSQGFPYLSEIFGSMGGMGMGGFPFHGMGGMGGMGMGGRTQQREKPTQIQEVLVKLKTREIFHGQSKNIDIVFNDKCNSCDGSGSKTKFKSTCSGCKGSGIKVSIRQIGPGMISQQQSICGDCNGRGKFVEPKDKCSVCSGKGTIESKLNKTLEITKNFDYENVMLLKNSGNYDPETDTKADINIKFIISDIDKYNMTVKNSYDLLIEHPINIYDALTGYTMFWSAHPDENKYNFKFSEVIKDGDIRFVKNLGLPINDNGNIKRGKLYIKFNYIYPLNILDNESYKTFIKTKDNKQIENKDSYIRVKVYDIKDDKSNNNQRQRKSSDDNGENIDLPNCTQS